MARDLIPYSGALPYGVYSPSVLHGFPPIAIITYNVTGLPKHLNAEKYLKMYQLELHVALSPPTVKTWQDPHENVLRPKLSWVKK